MGCGCCYDGMCTKCHGVKKVVFGLLLLLNAFLWPKWLGVDGWVAWLAVLAVLAGALKLAKPSCGHCAMPAEKKKK